MARTDIDSVAVNMAGNDEIVPDIDLALFTRPAGEYRRARRIVGELVRGCQNETVWEMFD
jgi:hypothetical protein